MDKARHKTEGGGKGMDIRNLEELKDFMDKELIGRDEAVKITGQSKGTFSNAVTKGHVPVFYRGGNQGFTLYLREDIDAYAEKKRVRSDNRHARKPI